MEIFFCAFVLFILYRIIFSSNNESDNKNNQRINDEIKAGRLVKLINGEVKNPKLLNIYEKRELPNYRYLIMHGNRFGYQNLDFMSVEEIDAASIVVQRKLREEENKKRILEDEKLRLEQEQRRAEELAWQKEKERKNLANRWHMLSMDKLFEIGNENSESNNAGIYVIHCIPDNRIYIGSTENMLKRKSQHLGALKSNKHHSFLLQVAFNELGEHNFKFYILQIFDSKVRFEDQNREAEEIKRILKREMKSGEQYFLTSYLPSFNVDSDSRGRRHWSSNSKYSRFPR